MAPSRGITALLRANCSATRSFRYPLQRQHALSRSFTSIPDLAADPARQTQIYISRSTDPYLNLSLEHYLLQSTPPTSTILLLYTNRPSLIIGRNQNPWVETNLALLRNPLPPASEDAIPLVRRRSGGGAVFHDEGNVNYCVITPTSSFDRDKHAHMVVRALHSLGATRAAVNARHDIVLDVSPPPIPRRKQADLTTSAAATGGAATPTHRKVSGSAYKLTRLRSLHHGTCLLSSPNIGGIGAYLRSPGKGYMLARGVDSVSSPIANVRVGNGEFEGAVVEEFGEMYGGVEVVEVGEEDIEAVEAIEKGVNELRVCFCYVLRGRKLLC
jgi:lipoate-protein ligase A